MSFAGSRSGAPTRALGWRMLILTSALALSTSAPARAQVALQQYQPAPLPSDGFVLGRPTVPARHEWALSASADYAREPLVYRLDRGPRLRQVVVSDHFVVHMGGAWGLHRRVLLFANLPIHALMKGDRELLIPKTSPDGAGLGDLTLGARVALLGEDESLLGLAGELVARLPTAELAKRSQRYTGDEFGSYEAGLIGELRAAPFAGRLRLGVRLRRPVEMQNLELGQEFLFGTGVRVRLPWAFSLHAELFGATYLARAFERHHTPFELLLGPRYQYRNFVFGIAGGPGLVDGYGAPDFRVLGTVSFVSSAKGQQAVAASARSTPPSQVDFDGDGVFDERDHCREQAEDRDGVQDADGCPDFDDDGDGIPDVRDRCPRVAEDAKGVADADGCPTRDHDNDAIEDGQDRCPQVPGVVEEQGCPAKVVESGGEPVKFGHVEFGFRQDASLPSSTPTLRAVQSILVTNPQITRIRVEGHAHDTNDVAFDQELSKRRARTAARWLMAHGIASDRIELAACGQSHPIANESTKAAHQRNRRVEFHVIKPPRAAPSAHDGCEAISIE